MKKYCRNDHDINYNNVQILDNESNRNKRLISEMINIHLQEPSINSKMTLFHCIERIYHSSIIF